MKTVKYYNNIEKRWIECIIYYFTGDISQGINGWVECEPHYYTGDPSQGLNGWVSCSHT